MINKVRFGEINGREVSLYILKNDCLEVSLSDYGATIVRVRLTLKNGEVRDLVRGYDALDSYVHADGYLGAFSNEITVIPEIMGGAEMLGWIAPRFSMFSTSRSYFSWLMPSRKYTVDARIKGGERHMIMSNEYDKVFPMDIYPEYLIKAIITGNIDKMEQLGIYEVAPEDFALCEFVDSSKLELQRIVREGLDKLRAEMC